MIPIQILEGIVGRSIIWNAILGFFAGLDRIAYTIFGWMMQGVFDIANAKLISSDVYSEFQTRVYVILGIFMLFKVTLSLLSYLVSPDKINDKERGISKMVTRTIVVICMLAGLPFVFNLLDRAQPILLEALPRIIIGKNMSVDTGNGQAVSSSINSQASSIADTMSWTTFQLSLNEETVALMESEGINTVAGATSVITDSEPNDSSKYKYYYIPVVGVLIAVVMSFLMIGFCIDIAIRSFKLIILRMIAPIPVISYIDPKAAKDGAFSNWTKTLISTWLDLFTRLGILYFVLYMIDAILLPPDFQLGNIGFFRNAVVILFVIIGLLFFARQAPKFISDALGIKNSKGLGVGLGGALAAGGALLGGAGIVGAAAAGMTAMNENADAAAQGKAGTASWGKGRDLAAQFRTGDKNAKGGITNRWAQNANRNAQQRTAARTLDREFGITHAGLEKKKTEMINLQNQSNAAKLAYQNGAASYTWRDKDGTYHNLAFTADALDDIAKIDENLGNVQRAYEKGSKIAESYGLDQTSQEKYRASTKERIVGRANNIAHPIKSHQDRAPERQGIKDRLTGDNKWK